MFLNAVPSRAALIAAAPPIRVSVPVPLPLTVTPVLEPSVRVPLADESTTVSDALSTSATVIALPLAAEKTSVASSATVCAPGSWLTGASLVPVTVRSSEAAEAAPAASRTV